MLAVLLGAAGCGGGGNQPSAPKGKDVAKTAGRVETADIVLETARRPARRKMTLDGFHFSGGSGWLLPVEMKLSNRRKGRLTVGAIRAEVTSQ